MGQGPAALLIHGTGCVHPFVARARAPAGAPPAPSSRPDLPATPSPAGRGVAAVLPPLHGSGVGRPGRRLGIDIGVCLGHSAGAAIGMRMVLDDLIRPQALLAASMAPSSRWRAWPALTFPLLPAPWRPPGSRRRCSPGALPNRAAVERLHRGHWLDPGRRRDCALRDADARCRPCRRRAGHDGAVGPAPADP